MDIYHTTPADPLSHSIERLKQKIGISSAAVVVPIIPSPDAEFYDCHRIVLKRVEEKGGRTVHGWMVLESAGYYIEGIFHSIWESPDGELIDLTPQIVMNETKTVFLPDSQTAWTGSLVPGHRLLLKKERFFQRQKQIDEDIEEYQIEEFQRNGGPGPLSVDRLFKIFRRRTWDNDACMCASGLKFKKCCKDAPLELAKNRWARSGTVPGLRRKDRSS